ncbi:MAG: TolC family protein, partial [Bacteroidales bacterium]
MKKFSALSFWVFLQIGGIQCQQLITLDQAVSIGLTNNYGIIISKNSVEAARNNATPGNAGMLPTVGLNAGYVKGLNNAQVKVITGAELDKQNAHSDLITAGVGLNWKIFDGLNMFITYDKLKKLEEASDLSAKIIIESTIAEISAAYYEIVRQGRVLQMLTEQVDISRFRLDLARMRYETGTGSEIEFQKSRVELNADLANLSIQNTRVENSKITLNDLLAREVKTEFAITDTLLVSEVLNYDSLVNSMKTTNRNLQLTTKNKQVGELEVKTAIAEQWPTLDYTAGFNYYRSATDANFIQYNRNYGPTMGLSLNMKIFDGLNQKRRYKNAVLSLQSYDLEIKQMESKLEAHLARIFNEYRNQLEMIGFEQENLQLAL